MDSWAIVFVFGVCSSMLKGPINFNNRISLLKDKTEVYNANSSK